jgi:hypothetical protein
LGGWAVALAGRATLAGDAEAGCPGEAVACDPIVSSSQLKF